MTELNTQKEFSNIVDSYLENVKDEKIVFLQSQSRIDVEQLEDLIVTGVEGAKQIGQILKNKLRKHTVMLLKQKNSLDVNFDSSTLNSGSGN